MLILAYSTLLGLAITKPAIFYFGVANLAVDLAVEHSPLAVA